MSVRTNRHTGRRGLFIEDNNDAVWRKKEPQLPEKDFISKAIGGLG